MAFGGVGGTLVGSARVLLGVDGQTQFDADISRSRNQFRRATGDMERDAHHMSRGVLAASGVFGHLSRTVAFASAGFLGGAGLGFAVRSVARELGEADKVATQTNAVIKSTGSIAGVTAAHVAELANQLLRKTGIDDEAIASSENLLLTFTNVRNVVGAGNDIFDQATLAVSNMAASLKNGLEPNAIRLGKALQDPILGVTALRRVGVAFTEQQKDQIRTLVESGKVLAAQKIILHELNVEFGGSAEAAGTTLPRAFGRARETLLNLAAGFATVLTPEVRELADWLQKEVDALENSEEKQQQIRDTLHELAGATKSAAEFTGDLAHAADSVADAMGGWDDAFKLLVGGTIAVKLARILGILGGPGGTGAGGILGMMTRLKALGPVSLVIALTTTHKTDLQDIAADRIHKEFGGIGAGAVGALGTSAKNAIDQGVGGLAIPTTVRPTHETSNLPGFPAVDLFAKAGTPVLAPENGQLSRTSGNSPEVTPAAFKGYSLYYVGEETGNTYFITHLAAVAVKGRYRRGDVIAIIAAGTAGGDHAHVGIHKGVAPGAFDPSSSAPPAPAASAGIAQPTSATTTGGAAPPVNGLNDDTAAPTDLIPLRLQQKRADAMLTAAKADDLAALRAIESYIVQRLKSVKDAKKRLALTQELSSTKDEIAGLMKQKPTVDDVIPIKLQVRLIEAELTKATGDDLRVLGQIERYLEQRIKKTRDLKKKKELLEQLQSVRNQRQGVLEGIPQKPEANLAAIPGLGAALELFGQLSGGVVPTPMTLPGIGRILYPVAPNVDDWNKLIEVLKKKLVAAVQRKGALERSLKRLRAQRIKGAGQKAQIQRHITAIAALNNTIRDLRSDIGEAVAAIGELLDMADSQAQKDADEAEKLADAQAADALQAAESAAREAEQVFNEAQASASSLSPDLQLAIAQAEGTKAVDDDLAALRQAEAFFQGELDSGQVRTGAGTFALTTMARVGVTQQLNSIRSQIERLTEEQQKGNTIAEQQLNTLGFLTGLRGLRGFQSNIFDPLASLNGSTITVHNYFPASPEDPHLFVKGIEFELKALV